MAPWDRARLESERPVGRDLAEVVLCLIEVGLFEVVSCESFFKQKGNHLKIAFALFDQEYDGDHIETTKNNAATANIVVEIAGISLQTFRGFSCKF